ncbi:hypothetical protein Y032_0118g774 [Ancylostoma ceylanicum]|nr:hypothetical protein Y032_0118g774 [Ancylostoma ceylanicum]
MKYLWSLLYWIVTGPIFCIALGILVGWHVPTIMSHHMKFGSGLTQPSNATGIHEIMAEILGNETERVYPLEDNEHRDERIIADFVASKVRVFCWIVTDELRHRTQAKAVKSTWAQRCNKHIFISTRPDETLPAIDLGIASKKRSSWQKTRAILQFVHDRYINHYDWFLAARDDSYVILENLRYMLLQYSPDDAMVLASHTLSFPNVSTGSPVPMPGFTLSRGAVRRIVTDGLVNSPSCYKDNKKSEAEATMECFQESRVRFVDTRDRDNAHSLHVCFLHKDHFGQTFTTIVSCDILVREKGRGQTTLTLDALELPAAPTFLNSYGATHKHTITALVTEPTSSNKILPLKPQEHIPPYQLVFNTSSYRWLESSSIHAYPSGMKCCSEYPISFHNLPYRTIYSMEFFIYRQRIFGVDRPAMRNGDEKMVWLQLFGETMDDV